MKLIKKRSFAIFVCVIAVIGSILVSTHVKLGARVNEVKSCFVDGVNHDSESIYGDLQMRVGLAHNLTAVAKRYVSADELSDVETAADELSGVVDPKLAYRLNVNLETAVQSLNLALMHEELSETDEKYRSGIMTEFNSYSYSISHDEYNNLVRSFNEYELGKFPASLLSKLAFVGTVEYFS